MNLRFLLARLARLEKAAAETAAGDARPFAGSPRWWQALYLPWPDDDLTDAERAELAPLYARDTGPADDPVEAEIAAVRALPPTSP